VRPARTFAYGAALVGAVSLATAVVVATSLDLVAAPLGGAPPLTGSHVATWALPPEAAPARLPASATRPPAALLVARDRSAVEPGGAADVVDAGHATTASEPGMTATRVGATRHSRARPSTRGRGGRNTATKRGSRPSVPLAGTPRPGAAVPGGTAPPPSAPSGGVIPGLVTVVPVVATSVGVVAPAPAAAAPPVAVTVPVVVPAAAPVAVTVPVVVPAAAPVAAPVSVVRPVTPAAPPPPGQAAVGRDPARSKGSGAAVPLGDASQPATGPPAPAAVPPAAPGGDDTFAPDDVDGDASPCTRAHQDGGNRAAGHRGDGQRPSREADEAEKAPGQSPDTDTGTLDSPAADRADASGGDSLATGSPATDESGAPGSPAAGLGDGPTDRQHRGHHHH